MAAGPSPVEDELYREIILDHWRNPRRKGHLEPADVTVEGYNPLCGDEVLLTMRVREGSVEAIAFDGHGCSISRASASMMCEGVDGLSVAEAADLVRRFKAMMLEGAGAEDLGDLEALQGVARIPLRIKCAVLPWNALLEGLERGEGTVTTEEGPLS
ncbi:MAG: SUF system NifU family Fe-S cluster assembly protein [Chloroflexi bacterium]|nr:MAG: SUF system NifU family Fe-S cluster assembly protein [Chloroflexota bacterium]